MRILSFVALGAIVALTPTLASAQGNSGRPDIGRPDNPGLDTAAENSAGADVSDNAERAGETPDPDDAGNGAANAGDIPGNGLGNAAGGGSGSAQSAQDRAAQAVRTGQAVPLDRVLRPALEQHGGSLIDTRLLTVEGFLLYELKILLPDGTLDTLYYYAHTGNPVR
ncbi:hypothetical protein OF122_07540 [Pelagibacterium flavum]|uniref:PepSY domain-containing protein n=1 Tax=Pelagibacterium flavum TaxID=2984530 RepID=A0ABY6ISQ0_9HYPH|nr:hypothetical protein [Pelagibacterium sp. YIM 151497]UYQ73598.1 hypothetical protein OF122_07540 [Pelagibacterium sp. YIM 151497]|tara:strand:+ start:871 stop:1371 length:501 start_codon:yes stop_codon:yes gene_type:complete